MRISSSITYKIETIFKCGCSFDLYVNTFDDRILIDSPAEEIDLEPNILCKKHENNPKYDSDEVFEKVAPKLYIFLEENEENIDEILENDDVIELEMDWGQFVKDVEDGVI